ncbi:MAG: polysaccharide deacetylase family protein [Verrucomicrobiota bacterium]
MTRFHFIALLAAAVAAVALACGQWGLLIATLLALFTAIGLGVTIPQLRFFGNFICSGNPAKRQVALTFDDGPDARSTPALLDLLREHDVEAAFFAIGRCVDAEPKLANQILRGGHLLENHTYHHSNATNFYSTAKLTEELARTQQAIERHTGTTPRFFRPPVGLTNPNTFHAAAALKLKVIGWNIRSLDRRITDPEQIIRRIERGLTPGAIILLHDADIPAERLVVTVKLLLAKLREHRYEVVRLDRLLG